MLSTFTSNPGDPPEKCQQPHLARVGTNPLLGCLGLMTGLAGTSSHVSNRHVPWRCACLTGQDGTNVSTWAHPMVPHVLLAHGKKIYPSALVEESLFRRKRQWSLQWRVLLACKDEVYRDVLELVKKAVRSGAIPNSTETQRESVIKSHLQDTVAWCISCTYKVVDLEWICIRMSRGRTLLPGPRKTCRVGVARIRLTWAITSTTRGSERDAVVRFCL
eukprot:3436389-Amphidinium_carterae.1